MAHTYKQVHRTTTVREGDNDLIENNAVVPGTFTAARVVSLVGGIIMAVLAMRFLLSLLGANRENAFASFIYAISYPFAAPFFGLFNYQPQFGVVRFEFETLVAIAFWGFVTWMIARLLTVRDIVD